MAQFNQRSRQGDASLVCLGQDHEVAYWTRHFAVDEAQLRLAIRKVGTSAVRIGAWLKKESEGESRFSGGKS